MLRKADTAKALTIQAVSLAYAGVCLMQYGVTSIGVGLGLLIFVLVWVWKVLASLLRLLLAFKVDIEAMLQLMRGQNK